MRANSLELNCESVEDIKSSMKLFNRIETWDELLELWSSFYDNEICIPCYLSTFTDAEDNPEADRDMAEKFKTVTSYGIITTGSQASIKGNQKGFIEAFVPKGIARLLTTYLNRYPGIVAWYHDIAQDSTKGLFVTYDDYEAQIQKYKNTGVMLGEAFTQLGFSNGSCFEEISTWLENLNHVWNTSNLYTFIVVDTVPDDNNRDRALDLLIMALKDNEETIYYYNAELH